jgi:hypothetical protein
MSDLRGSSSPQTYTLPYAYPASLISGGAAVHRRFRENRTQTLTRLFEQAVASKARRADTS